MKDTERANYEESQDKDMLAEYRFDYSRARPNRFADKLGAERLMVVLDPDVATVFSTPESVNNVLRALIATMPKVEGRTESS